uniref:Uncharacterized protein n=1 Tax=Tanacetum cinerariifolium TaxID=118510 RepID=A0A699HUH8_TANCI|nr:hypothetical protein [Tanacetum cinerariifolium]
MESQRVELVVELVTKIVKEVTEADRLLHHEVEGRVDGLVEEVEEIESQRVELVVELVTKIVKEVTEVSGRMEVLTKSLNSSWSSLSNCKTCFLPSLLK